MFVKAHRNRGNPGSKPIIFLEIDMSVIFSLPSKELYDVKY